MIGEAEVRIVAQQHIGTPPDVVREVPNGFGHITFVVDEQWIFRFAKTDAVAEKDRMEQLALPIINSSVSFAVPEFEHSGDTNGVHYVGYRLIPGRSLERRDVPDLVSPSDLGQFLHELHSVDRAAIASRLDVETTGAAWRARYRILRERARTELAGTLDVSQLEHLDEAFGRFLDVPFAFEPVVVHGDLGTSHILVDDREGLVGMLDFEAVTIGDPAIDFVGLIITLGPDVCRTVIHSYPGQVDRGFWQRLLGYWWIGSLFAVFHGVATHDADLTRAASAGLNERLRWVDRLHS